MTSKERVMAVIHGEMPDKVPFIEFINTRIGEKISDHYGVAQGDLTGLCRAIGMDAIGCDDYCAPLFAEGVFDESGVFVPTKPYITGREDLDKMVFPDYTAPGFYDKAKRFIDQYGDSGLALYAGGRLFSVFATLYSMGFENFSYALAEDPEVLTDIAKKYADWEIEVFTHLQDLGFDFVMGYNDMAYKSGPFISPGALDEYFMPVMKEVCDTLMRKTPICIHSDGKLDMIYSRLIDLGMSAIHPNEPTCMDITDIKKKYGKQVTIWGNVDLNILGRGTVQETVDAVKELLRTCAPGGRYIFSANNCLPDWVKIENVVAMIDTFNQYREYPICL